MNEHYLAVKNDLSYWVNEAKEIMNMIEDEKDDITCALTIGSYLRRFYMQGKEHGVWEYNNRGEGIR